MIFDKFLDAMGDTPSLKFNSLKKLQVGDTGNSGYVYIGSNPFGIGSTLFTRDRF